MPARSDALLVALTLSLAAGLAHAAAPPWPTPEAIERAREAHPLPSLERLNRVPVQAVPRITPSRPGLDLEEIARRHAHLHGSSSESRREPPALRIFVSLAMPEQSLRLLAAQAERSGATLVLRGLKANSMKQTLDAVQALIGERKVAWQIDPEAFARYGVQRAPTFVLNKAADGRELSSATCGAHCATAPRFYSVAGDVSLDYALDALVRRHPDAGRDARPYVERLRVTP